MNEQKHNPSAKVYFISGLGADHRVFERISLPEGFSKRHIHWLEPGHQEPLKRYAFRLLSQIDQTQPFWLVGLSFGGLLASEMAQLSSPQKVILISSFANCRQIPRLYRMAGFLKLHRIIPLQLHAIASSLMNWLFGADTKEEQTLIKSFVHHTDAHFFHWALGQCLTWQHNKTPDNLIHIHGSSDRLIPYHKVQADTLISHGGHLMVWSHASQINQYLAELLQSNPTFKEKEK
ncbi:alpha/beta hydrolase [Rapidithrix thailandica]|uniref:Alpha/beta hydrolase n=1 Tax=Rapidithrix thailandica TaxID=413964 RepID=A0AAW9SB09_9BACT